MSKSTPVDKYSSDDCSDVDHHRELAEGVMRKSWLNFKFKEWLSRGMKLIIRSSDDQDHETSISGHGPNKTTRVAAANCGIQAEDLGPGLRGLVNLGNTCYMNSALQCLSSTVPLKEYFIGPDYHIKSDTGGILANSFSSLLKKLWNDDPSMHARVCHDLKSIKRITARNFAHRYSDFSQCDSQEFLMHILEGLHEDLKDCRPIKCALSESSTTEAVIGETTDSEDASTKHVQAKTSIISDLFQGLLETHLICGNKGCAKVFKTYDAFMFLSLPLPGPDELRFVQNPENSCSLEECLQLMTKETASIKDNWYCELCEMSVILKRKVNIIQPPEILVLCLKRFHASRKGRYKLGTHVNFPKVLDLNQSLVTEKSCTYELFAMIDHHGSLSSGHYTASTQINGQWYFFNDSKVLPDQEFKNNRSVYVLFYKRKHQLEDWVHIASLKEVDSNNYNVRPSLPINNAIKDDESRDSTNDTDLVTMADCNSRSDVESNHESKIKVQSYKEDM